jgi:hypothetical protein
VSPPSSPVAEAEFLQDLLKTLGLKLNDIFSAFDRIVELFNCERMKTIGDAYMAVAGIPEESVYDIFGEFICNEREEEVKGFGTQRVFTLAGELEAR